MYIVCIHKCINFYTSKQSSIYVYIIYNIHVYIHTLVLIFFLGTQICYCISIIIEGQFQVFQRFSIGQLVLKTVESRFTALNCYGNGGRGKCLKKIKTSGPLIFDLLYTYPCVSWMYTYYISDGYNNYIYKDVLPFSQ